ncbi:MAG: ABC transporter permease [Velocimicrobium sp.]
MVLYMMSLNIKAKLQYGHTLLYEIISYLIRYPVEFIAAWIILYNFKTVGGWNFSQVLFLQAVSFVVISLGCAFTWEPMVCMEGYIVEGKLDQFLIAPINPFWYVIGMNFRATNLVITIICGAIATFAANKAGVALSPRIIFYVIGLIGAVFIVAAFNVLIGTLSFWIYQTHNIMSFMIDTVGELLKYPITIYTKGVRFLLTFILPISLINYYPTSYLLVDNKMDWWIMIVILGVGIGLFYLAYRLWYLGLKQYKSAGG